MRKHVIIALLVAGLSVASLSGCGPTAYKITPIAADESLQETVVQRDPGLTFAKIALIDIDGMLINAEQPGLISSQENPTALVVEKLRKAHHDRLVKAVVIRINSPGGTVTASDILYREIKKVREGTDRYPGKPVVALIMDVGASGGFYLACAADKIFAEPTAITGSIGVIMMTFDLKTLLDKVGVQTDAIKSGPKKDAGSIFRPMEPEERKVFQTMIDEYYEGFLGVVIKARSNLDESTIRTLADGRIYTGKQAAELGLIDQTGSIDSAIEQAKTLATIKRARVVMYHRPAGYRGTVYAHDPAQPAKVEYNLINMHLPEALRSQGYFMYLWQP